MHIDLLFHAKMDKRGKIQIPKREYEARNWKPGTMFTITATPYIPSPNQLYQVIREKVLERDNHKCQKCGSTTRIIVHHLVPRRYGGSDEMSNLSVLCTKCHRNAHIATGQEGFLGKRYDPRTEAVLREFGYKIKEDVISCQGKREPGNQDT